MIDLSRNEVFESCPLQIFADAAIATSSCANLYPTQLRAITEKIIATAWDVPFRNLILTRGIDDAVDLFAASFTGRRFLTFVPGFDAYVLRLLLAEEQTKTIEWLIDSTEVPLIGEIYPSDAILIASPGNPCGRTFPEGVIQFLCSKGLKILLDHAYFDFTATARSGVDGHSQLLARLSHPGIFHYFSFSKAWALAGLRLGVLIGSDVRSIERMRHTQMYDLVDTFSLHTLRGAFASRYVSPIAENAVRARDRLTALLKVNNRRVVSRGGNFVTVEDHMGDLARLLISAGIITKELTQSGLPGWIRISAPSLAAYEVVAAAFR